MAGLDRRGLGLGILGLGLAAGLPRSAWAGAAVAADPFAMVDPDLLAMAKMLPHNVIGPDTLATLRARPAGVARPAPAPQAQLKTIPGPAGAPDVRLVLFDGTRGQKGRPAYLHMHGGGFVIGRVASNPANLQEIAEACQALVVSVDYRQAPETVFPGALEDNYAALKWLVAQAGNLGIDPARIAIGGESAGGGHAAMLAIAARDRGEVKLAFQLLIYPMLDDRTGSTLTPPPHVGHFLWQADSNRYGWASLLGQAPGLAKTPKGAVPARLADVSGLAPAFIGVGGLDLFADEDVAYARRLMAAGVPTELLVVPGAYHGFDGLVPNAPVSLRFKAEALAALKRGLGVS